MNKTRIRQTIVSNDEIAQRRHDRYYNVISQYNRAISNEFYIEAITLMESLLSDRLESLLNQLGSTSEYSFLPLGNLLSALKKYRTLSEFEEIINKLDDGIMAMLLQWTEDAAVLETGDGFGETVV